MSQRGVRVVFWLGWILVVVTSVAGLYLVNPFPGSQELDSLRFLWYLNRLRPWLVGAGGILLLSGLVLSLRSSVANWRKVGAVFGVGFAGFALWLAVDSRLIPAHRYQPPRTVRFASGPTPEVPATTMVLGIASAGQAKAYPVATLAYHHRLVDTLGGQTIWVSYCGMCGSGKVFRPEANGRKLTFDLVGGVRYNSVYTDRETGSYWYQANGRAVMGPLAGAALPELLSDQMTLGEWMTLHPGSGVFQPDPAFTAAYRRFNFSLDPKVGAKLEPRWQWVVGVREGGVARSYPWSLLTEKGLVQDRLGELPLAIVLRDDGISYRVWDRRLGGRELDLTLDRADGTLVDSVSGSRFGFDGVARGGTLEGQQLRQVQGSHEFLHSFEGFSGGELYQPTR